MQNTFPQKIIDTFFIDGPAGRIEMLTTYPEILQHKTVAIICHPHPLQQGTMHNKVVTTLSKAYEQLGMPTVRFNFRGVGKSEGVFDHAVGEVDDAYAVWAWTQQTLPDFQWVFAGFSFGSYIAAKMTSLLQATQHLVTISPAVDRYDFASCAGIQCPWLLVMGEADEVVDPQSVWDFARKPPAPLELIKVPHVGHFYHGQLVELRQLVMNWIRNLRSKEDL